MKRIPFLFLTGFIFFSIAAASEPSPILAQKPTLNRTHVVFVYAGDLWKVSRGGGAAQRLTSGPGMETSPVFSPDGARIAFTGEYDGNVDVFVMPAEGGEPRRLTWHPAADIVLGWTPDGKEILFTSNRTAYSRFSELFTVSAEGGFPKRLPLPMGFEGSFSADGARIAYVPLRRAFNVWKRYRGGQATPIWIADLADSKIEKIPRKDSNDFEPMWVGNKVYFLSDREGPVTLFSFDIKTKEVTRAVQNDGLDLKSASAGPGAIVYEQFGSLNLYDLATGKTSSLPVSIAGDMIEVRDKFVNVGASLESPSLSPSGARAAFEARGEIITVPEEKGDARNLTNTPGAMERFPSWSPDGQKIAYFSDEAGEYQLHIRDQKGDGEVVRIDLEKKPSFYFAPDWSPDGKKIAYEDSHLSLWYVDLEKKAPVKVDKDRFPSGDLAPGWSPDSKWLAYVKRLPNYLGAIFLYSLENGQTTRVTDGMSDAASPVFDAGGKYLYFTASTDSGPSLQPDIHSIFREVSSTIYLAVLDKTEPTPFVPQSDEEKPADQPKKAPDETAKKQEEKKTDENVVVKVDLDGILQRILAIPMPARRYVDLDVGEAGTLLAVASDPPLPGTPFSQSYSVHRFDLKERRADVVVGGVDSFEMARGGKKYLYSQKGSWRVGTLKPMLPSGAPAPPQAAGPGSDKTMPTQNIQLHVRPLEEWHQMYREVWRIEREFFYDANLHGLDLDWVQKKYAPYLEAVASRIDLNYLFAEMLGEMTVGHLAVGGGDIPRAERVATGLLGADFAIENGRYRFTRIYGGENWNPQFQAPLTQPGVDVKAGEYLLAVDGRELKGTDNIYSFFEAKAGKQVVLTVGPEPRMKGSRDVAVVPISSETPLRNFSWIEDNRRYVERVTNGRAAYVYMPDTAFGGYAYFNRYFYAQVGREALIVDERFNGGGMLATDIIERFGRKMMSLVATRDGEDQVQPQGAIFGPKVMLINEFAGSGGDAMPWYFQRAKVGPLVGKRTWGGLVGMAGGPSLMDGGFVTAPSAGVWSPDGHWIAENIGVIPDFEVELDPALVRQGKDPQLDKAIEIVMDGLAKNPPQKPKRPLYPDYHKK